MTSVKMLTFGRNRTLICLLALVMVSARAGGDYSPLERGAEALSGSDQRQVFKQFGVWWPKVSSEGHTDDGEQAGGHNSPRTISRRSLPTDFRPESNWPPGPASSRYNHHHHHHHQQHRHEQASNLQPPDYKIITTCEGNQAELRCENDRRIHLVRAVYGRFSLAICNEQGYSNYSVNCARFQVFLQIETRCNNLTACNVPVSTELFGEPCEGTTKYLEVQYSCNDVNNQTNNNRLPPPGSAPPPPPAVANQLAAPSNSHKSHPQADQNSALAVGGGIGSSNQVGPSPPLPPSSSSATTPKTSETSNTNTVFSSNQGNSNSPHAGSSGGFNSINLATTTPPSTANRQQQTVIQRQHYCLPQTSSRNVSWNFTRAGQVALRPCPDGSSGASASWTCDAERLRFVPLLTPDFSQCRSIWLAKLSRELNEMLDVSPGRHQYSIGARQQDLQMFRSILSELSILARERKVFSGDLKSIDIMISQMITQLRSYAVQSGLESPQFGWTSPAALSLDGRGGQQQQHMHNSPMLNVYGELFSGLASICSSLFDPLQRNAWLELESDESRRFLESRLLSHLKEAGLLFVRSLTSDQVADMQPIRQANIIASISVIINNQLRPSLVSSGGGAHAPSDRTNELNPFGRPFDGNNAPLLSQAGDEVGGNSPEFRLQPQLVSELASNGITKFLVLDIKKPDYSLMRAQLEQQLESQSISPDFGQSLAVDQAQFQKRIFGLFAINENGESLDVASLGSPRLQPDPIRQRLGELLAQWPVSVEFRVLPFERLTTGIGSVSLQPVAAAAQCQSLPSDTSNDLADDGQGITNRCHLARYNATNFVCSCDRFGFVALAQLSGPRIDILGDDPAMIIGSSQPNPSQSQNKLQPKQSVGIVAYIFVVIGVTLLIISGVGLMIKFIGRSRLNKKQRGLFESLRNGPTTGPLAANHNLMGSDPLVSGAATTQSASIIGLNSGVCTNSSNYKTHQQLYSTQMGAHYVNSHDSRAWTSRLFGWLLERPSTWLSSITSPGQPHGTHHTGKSDRIDVQHSIIGGNNSTIGTLAYSKSQYQNGYTTSLGLHNPIQQHQTLRANLGGSQSAVPLNPSSNSSYVSSSAYYEEIGPGNMTKVNANQLSGASQQHQQQATGGDLFMMKQRQQYLDAQNVQSMTHHHHHPHLNTHHQHTFHQWQTQTPVGMASSHQHPATMITKQQHLHNDLSLLQSSSSSSASSQHSSSTNGQPPPPPPNGATTPRHFLFASPIAVNAYKQQQQHRGSHYSHNQ